MSGLDTSVFDTSKMTITEDVAKAFTDDAVVHIKYREGLGNISEPNFLAGVTEGQEQVLVKGSRSIDIQKQLETKIHGNEIRQVDEGRRTVISKTVRPAFTGRTTYGPGDATEYLEVRGGRKTVITKYDDRKVMGNDIWTVMGACFKTIHGGELDNNIAKLIHQHADMEVNIGKNAASLQVSKAEVAAIKLDINGILRELAGIQNELMPLRFPRTALENKLVGFLKKHGPAFGLIPY
jgi:hypothetical protein